MVKILLLTGDAGEAQEIYYAKFRLEEEGWQVHIVAAGEARLSSRSCTTSTPASIPTPRSRAIASRPTSVSTMSIRRPMTGSSCPAAGRPSTCGTGRRRSRSSATSSRAASRSRPTATALLLVMAAGGAKGKTITCYPDLVARRPGRGRRVRQPRCRRRRRARHGPRMARQRPLDARVRQDREGRRSRQRAGRPELR